MRHPARGFSLVEVGLSTIIIGGLLVAALTAAGTISVSRRRSEVADRAASLATALLDEALTLPYTSSATGLLGLGPSAAETAAGNRSLYNAVGDYSGLSESTLRNRDGSAVANSTGWRRTVTLTFVESAAPNTESLVDTRCVRVKVTVFGPGATVTPLATAIGLRSLGWDVANRRTPADQLALSGTVTSSSPTGSPISGSSTRTGTTSTSTGGK